MRRQDKLLKRYAFYIKAFIVSFLVVIALTAYYGLDQRVYGLYEEWFFAVLVSLMLSYLIALVVVKITGGLFVRKLRVFKLSLPLFPVLVIALKIWLFGGL